MAELLNNDVQIVIFISGGLSVSYFPHCFCLALAIKRILTLISLKTFRTWIALSLEWNVTSWGHFFARWADSLWVWWAKRVSHVLGPGPCAGHCTSPAPQPRKLPPRPRLPETEDPSQPRASLQKSGPNTHSGNRWPRRASRTGWTRPPVDRGQNPGWGGVWSPDYSLGECRPFQYTPQG